MFLGHSVTQHKNVSDETAHAIDGEIRAIVDRNYERASSILQEHLDKLHMMADALIKYETIDSDQINDIMAGKVPREPQDWDDNSSSGSRGATAGSKSDDSKDGADPIGGPAGQH